MTQDPLPFEDRTPEGQTPQQEVPPPAPRRARGSRSSKVQRVLFWSLVGSIILMALLLFREHRLTLARYSNLSEVTPLSAPYVDTESVTLAMADDSTGAIAPQQREVALPQDPTIRARALLDRLFAEYALPQSTHPLTTSAAIDEIFLVDLSTGDTQGAKDQTDLARLRASFSPTVSHVAVVSLRGTFVQAHPSGIAVEELTLRSIVGTLHANLHDIEQVRFLVDGQPRDTLAGHADLSRAYSVIDTTSTPIQPAIDISSDNSSDTSPQN